MVDSTRVISSTGSLKYFVSLQGGITCKGPSATLVVLNNTPTDGFWSILTIQNYIVMPKHYVQVTNAISQRKSITNNFCSSCRFFSNCRN